VLLRKAPGDIGIATARRRAPPIFIAIKLYPGFLQISAVYRK
jgi:hypothetical protein